MEKLLDKSMAQTDEVIGMAQRFSDEIGRLEAERDKLREINKELVEALHRLLNCDLHLYEWHIVIDALDKAEKTA